MTFVASASCIISCGADAVFADIGSKTWNLDPDKTQQRISSKTKAIITVDYAGLPSEIRKLARLAKKHDLWLIRDASHSLGALEGGKPVGAGRADMTVFSFHPVKNMTTAEGGMVVTQNRELYDKLLMFRNHGIVHLQTSKRPWWYEVREYGNNYRMSELHAALGRVQLKKLSGFIRKRRALVRQYKRELEDCTELVFQKEPKGMKSAYHLLVVEILGKGRTLNRETVFKKLLSKGIQPQVHYIPLNFHPFFRANRRKGHRIYPVAERHYDRCLSLPLFPAMAEKDVKRVTRCLKEAFESRV